MIDIIGLVFIGVGLAFDIFGALGLVRLPDVYNRLQAATKSVTLGTCSILFGTFLIVGFCAVLSLVDETDFYLNVALAWALLSFIGTIALSKYLEGRNFDD